MGLLVALLFAFGALFVLPVLLFKLLLGLIFLPFKILGVVFRLVFGILGAVFHVGFAIVGLVVAMLGVALLLLFLPLLPFLIVGGSIWLLSRLARPSRLPRLAA
jgi:hypothetical protein